MRRRKRIVTPTAPTDVAVTDAFAPAPPTARHHVLTPMLERLRALAMLQHLRLRLHQHTKKVEIRLMTELAEKYGFVAWEEAPAAHQPLAGSPNPAYDGYVTATAPAAQHPREPLGWMSVVLILVMAVICNGMIFVCLRRPSEKPSIETPTAPDESPETTPQPEPADPPADEETIVLDILNDSDRDSDSDEPPAIPRPLRSPLPPPGSPGRAGPPSAAAGFGSGDFGSDRSGGGSPLSPSLLRAFPPPYEDDPPPPYNSLLQNKPARKPQSPRPPLYTPRAASPLSLVSEVSFCTMLAAGTPWPALVTWQPGARSPPGDDTDGVSS